MTLHDAHVQHCASLLPPNGTPSRTDCERLRFRIRNNWEDGDPDLRFTVGFTQHLCAPARDPSLLPASDPYPAPRPTPWYVIALALMLAALGVFGASA